MRNGRRALALLLAATAWPLAGCQLIYGRPVEVEYQRGVTPTGVLWRDTLHGDGRLVRADSTVTVHYTARVHEGPEIDSTYARGTPETMSLADPLIPGLQEGLSGMRGGGRRLLVIPPDRAFGEAGVPGRVPPLATVDFHVEVVAVEPPAESPGESDGE